MQSNFTVKSIAKAVFRMPLIVVRAVLGRAIRKHNWSGVNSGIATFPKADANAHESSTWIQPLLLASAETLRFWEREGRFGPGPLPHLHLSLLAAVVHSEKKKVGIVDLGGGLGTGYVGVRSVVTGGEGVNYNILEISGICREGNRLFEQYPHVRFHSGFPDLKDVDICYVSTALQYFQDYRATIARLVSYQPKFVLFVRLAAGTIPTFWTTQLNIEGQKIPYWFINIDEIIEVMGPSYSVVFDEQTPNSYNMTNFPETHRLPSFRNILFARKA